MFESDVTWHRSNSQKQMELKSQKGKTIKRNTYSTWILPACGSVPNLVLESGGPCTSHNSGQTRIWLDWRMCHLCKLPETIIGLSWFQRHQPTANPPVLVVFSKVPMVMALLIITKPIPVSKPHLTKLPALDVYVLPTKIALDLVGKVEHERIGHMHVCIRIQCMHACIFLQFIERDPYWLCVRVNDMIDSSS